MSARSSRNAWQRPWLDASEPFEKTAKGASPSDGQSGRTSMEAPRASANGETARDGRPTWTARFRSRQTRTDLRVRQTAGETGCRCERRCRNRSILRETTGKHRAPSASRKVRLKTGPRAGESGVGSNAGPICLARLPYPADPSFPTPQAPANWRGFISVNVSALKLLAKRGRTPPQRRFRVRIDTPRESSEVPRQNVAKARRAAFRLIPL